MKGKKIVYKILILSAWLSVGSGLIVLLAAANKNQKQHLCKNVLVNIKGSDEKFFIDKKEILNQLKIAANGSLINRPVSAISLSKLEKHLKNHQWISKAQLYFDSKNILHVAVEERVPIARIFTTTGRTFYIDSSGHRMSLLENKSIRLPIISNFTSAKKLHASDSAMLRDITRMVLYISAHPFWSAQIAQLDITHLSTFEAIPVVGNHIIRLGSADGFEQKLKKLYLFYQNIISKTGFDKYKVIDVQFEDQIIGVKRGPTSVIDSLQLRKNIEGMMAHSEAALADSLLAMQITHISSPTSSTNFYTTPTLPDNITKANNTDNKSEYLKNKPVIKMNANQNTIKKVAVKTSVKKAAPKKQNIKKSEQKPKAVMTRNE